MNFRNYFVLYQLIFVIYILRSVQGDEKKPRTIQYFVNPGCGKECQESNINIVYIRAIGEDALHFLYAGGNFTEALSSIIIRSSNVSSAISIDWSFLQKNTSIFDSFKVLGDNHPSIFAFIFTKLYANGTSGRTLEWNFNDFEWGLLNQTEESNDNKRIEFIATKFKSGSGINLFSLNGSISINFTYINSVIANQNMPHLLFNSNNTQFNLVLKNLNVSELTKPRFTVQFALANRLDKGKMTLDKVFSIDDESSPGVFRVYNFYGQDSSAKAENTTYVQWKPVCYSMENDASRKSILSAKSNNPAKLSTDNSSLSAIEIIKQSLAYIVLGDGMINPTSSSTHLLNVTFGDSSDPDDKGYKNYNIWTASFGYGPPPTYTISLTIIMIICFGLGVPFVIIVVGSIYIIVKKRLRQNRLAYVSIDEHIN